MPLCMLAILFLLCQLLAPNTKSILSYTNLSYTTMWKWILVQIVLNRTILVFFLLIPLAIPSVCIVVCIAIKVALIFLAFKQFNERTSGSNTRKKRPLQKHST